jgi:hypothetical protein
MLSDLLSISLTCPYPSVEGEEKSVKWKEGQYDVREEWKRKENERKEMKDLMFGAE